MKYLSLILLLMLASCGRKMLPAPSITSVEKDSVAVKTTVTKRDTTISLPEKNVGLATHIDRLMDVINGLKWQNTDTSKYQQVATTKADGLRASLLVNKAGDIKVNCHEDSLKKVIYGLTEILQEVYHSKQKEKIVEKPYPVQVVKFKIPKWVWLVILYSILLTAWVFRTPIVLMLKKLVA